MERETILRGTEDERGVKWTEADPDVLSATINERQLKAIRRVIDALPGHDGYVVAWRVEVTKAEVVDLGTFSYTRKPTVFLFAETRVRGDDGTNALVLCRENYLFVIGPRGKVTQLAAGDRRRVDITQNFA